VQKHLHIKAASRSENRSFFPRGSPSPPSDIIILHTGGDHRTPPGEVVQKHLCTKASRSEDYHTPHWGSLSQPGEIIILPTGEVVPHQGRSSYSLSTGGWSLSPPGEIIILPPGGGAFPHRGSPSPPGETIVLPQGESFPHGGDHSTPPKGVKTRTNKNNKETSTNK
jgi:hypothetical protein